MHWFRPLGSVLRAGVFAGLLIAALGFISCLVLMFEVSRDLPKLPDSLNRLVETPQTLIYAGDGQVLMGLGERKVVPLSRVSKDFINAIVATEDHRFFEHRGINKLRILKGLYVTLFVRGRVQGASTITQQLAKNLFFSFERTWQRKFKELLVALQIEATNSKEEILEAYINQIHFGAGAQGVEKAAQTFFGKSAYDLDLGEAALLAGLPKSPTQYNPLRHLDRALKRRSIVLQRMVASGFITEAQAESADQITPQLREDQQDSRSGSYFVDALIQELIGKYGEDVVFHGGIKVYTTLDTRLQSYGISALSKGLDRLDELMGLAKNEEEKPQGALVAVDTASGAIKAMVGGRDYYLSEFNRVMNGRRQAGSGFKPFLYYAAFQKMGLHPGTLMEDRPVSIPVKGAPDWKPKNFEKTYQGSMVLKMALAHSVNTIAAQLSGEVGPEAVIDVAKSCGVKSPLQPVYSIALGTSPVSPLDMAAGFATFANLGATHEPFMIWRVEDALGRVIYERIVKDRQVLSPDLAYQVVDMMKAVVDQGSGRSVRQLGFNRPAAGKTGTTDNYRDAWFTGFTPSLCTSVWTGFDRKRMLKDKRGIGITGGRAAAPIWTDFMIQALNGAPERDFRVPKDLRFQEVQVTTGCPPGLFSRGEMVRVPLKPDQKPCQREEDELRP